MYWLVCFGRRKRLEYFRATGLPNFRIQKGKTREVEKEKDGKIYGNKKMKIILIKVKEPQARSYKMFETSLSYTPGCK